MKRTEFFLLMIPPTKTHQEKKIRIIWVNGKPKPQPYEPAELQAIRSKFMAHLAPHKPDTPFRGPVRLITKWCYPIPENSGHYNGEYKDTKPDTDNMIKMLKDCMEDTKFFVKSDAQVASEVTEKFWADKPGIYIAIEEIGG